MIARTPYFMLILIAISGVARAEIDPLPDALSAAYFAAERDLNAGKDRKEIADRLKPVVGKHPTSAYYKLASEFLTDLTESVKNSPKPDADPEKRLADTRIEFGLLHNAENWVGPLKEFLKKEPRDPVCQLVAADRKVIERLLPLLNDRSPTRVPRPRSGVNGSALNPRPRVCDVALAIIEYHSQCRFHYDTIYGRLLHQLPEDGREKVAKRVGEWWQENKDKSIAAGVRAQIPHAGSYPEKVWMAKNLVRLGEGQKTDDKEFGLNVLRDMLKEYRRSHVGGYVADALAELGDMSAVDVFHDEWKARLGQSGFEHDSKIAFYLCAHGKRREWELLHAISLEQVRDDKKVSTGVVWADVINSGKAGTNSFAIPILPLALGYVDTISSQPLQYPERAVALLQQQTEKDFGYKPRGTEAERRTAIRKAQQWWDHEGKAKYTFDYIEKHLIPAKRPLPKK